MDPQQKQKPDELIFELDDDYFQAELKQPQTIKPTTLSQNTSPLTSQTHSQFTPFEHDETGSNNTFCYTSPISSLREPPYFLQSQKKQPGSASSLFCGDQQSPLASFLKRGLLPSGAKEKPEPASELQAELTKCNTVSDIANPSAMPAGMFELEL